MPLLHRGNQAWRQWAAVVPRLEAIVLAAGPGARFGGGKLTAPWRGGVLLRRRPGRRLRRAGAVGDRGHRRGPGVDGGRRGRSLCAMGAGERLRIVHAADYALGIVRQPARRASPAFPPDADGAFVFLGDMPRIPLASCAPLAAALADGALAAAPIFDGRRGHPVLFAAPSLPHLLALRRRRGRRRAVRCSRRLGATGVWSRSTFADRARGDPACARGRASGADPDPRLRSTVGKCVERQVSTHTAGCRRLAGHREQGVGHRRADHRRARLADAGGRRRPRAGYRSRRSAPRSSAARGSCRNSSARPRRPSG